MLVTLMELRFYESDDYKIVKQEFNDHHGHFYRFMFSM